MFFIGTLKLDLNMLYILKIVEYYVVICFGAILKRLSDYTCISIAFYRLIELSRFRKINKRVNLSAVILWLVILSVLTNMPMVTWKRIHQVNNGTTFELKDNIIYVFGCNFTIITLYLKFLMIM